MAVQQNTPRNPTSIGIQINGLKPLTRHYVYLNGEAVPDSAIKPFGKKVREKLVTDGSGKINFTLIPQVSDFPTTDLQAIYKGKTSVSVNTVVVTSSYYASQLPIDYEKSTTSYSSFKVRF